MVRKCAWAFWLLASAALADGRHISGAVNTPVDQPDATETATDLQVIPVGLQAEAATPELNEPATILDPVTVTATKRRASPRDLPISIDALSGQELESSGASEMRDFLRSLPGVALAELQPGIYRIAIRGIESDNGGVTTQTSGVFIDDVPFNDPLFNQVRPDLPPFDLDGVEVLKGPQGTLFGGSGLAGAIRYRLADAEPGVWSAKGFGQYLSQAEGSPQRIGGLMANLPLGDDAALRLTAVRRLTGGLIDDLNSGVKDTDRLAGTSTRALARWNASEHLSVQLKAFIQRSQSDDRPWAENDQGRFEREETLGLSPSSSEFDIYALQFGYQLSWAELMSVTSFQRKRHESRNAGAERALGAQQLGQPVSLPTSANVDGILQELRLVSPDRRRHEWQWVTGLFAHRYHGITTQDAFADNVPRAVPLNLAHFEDDVTAEELAIFGEASKPLGVSWMVTAGVRAYRVETEGTTHGEGVLVASSGNLEQNTGGRIADNGINPKLALQYSASDRVSVYASAARGYRFGGIQIAAPSPLNGDVPTTYRPDSLWNYEMGLRTQWLDRTLVADAALYYIDWKDAQVQTSTGGTVALNVISNVGGARSHGAELDLRYRPPFVGLELGLATGYTNARTTEAFTAPSGTVVPSGTRLPGHPDFQLTTHLDYRWEWRSYSLRASLLHAVYGKGLSDIEHAKPIYNYRTTDARLSLNAPSAWGGQRSVWVCSIFRMNGLWSAPLSPTRIRSIPFTAAHARWICGWIFISEADARVCLVRKSTNL